MEITVVCALFVLLVNVTTSSAPASTVVGSVNVLVPLMSTVKVTYEDNPLSRYVPTVMTL